jgi:iron complex transport system ATP-binding protein
MGEGKKVLDVQNLSFAYGQHKVLHNINFSLNKGCFLTIIGPNGSGKTTLLNLLTGHLAPSTGQIYLNDKELSTYKIEELSQTIALVSQDVHVRFPFSCLEVVMMGRKPFKKGFEKMNGEDMDIVCNVMELTDTLRFAEKSITELSGGERQRVILARALAQTPEFLFLDEAFSDMDICYSVNSLNVLKELIAKKNITVISVMHDLNMADVYSDMVLALQDGKLVQWGITEEVMQPHIIKELFNISVKKIGERGLAVLPN